MRLGLGGLAGLAVAAPASAADDCLGRVTCAVPRTVKLSGKLLANEGIRA